MRRGGGGGRERKREELGAFCCIICSREVYFLSYNGQKEPFLVTLMKEQKLTVME